VLSISKYSRWNILISYKRINIDQGLLQNGQIGKTIISTALKGTSQERYRTSFSDRRNLTIAHPKHTII
jgi:hypothetical protein